MASGSKGKVEEFTSQDYLSEGASILEKKERGFHT